MSDTPAAPAADTGTAGATPAADTGTSAPVLGTAPTESTPPPEPGTEVNGYEETFGKYFEPDGSAKEGWTAELPEELGLDEGRRARLGRQTSFTNLVKALDNAQTQIEKRDGAGQFVPDPSNENAFNDWRRDNDIPVDLEDHENGYNLKPDEMPEGAEFDEGLAKALSPFLQEANVPRGQAKAMAEALFNHQAQATQAQLDAMQKTEQEHDEKVYNLFKEKWGPEFDSNNKAITKIAESYGFDVDNEARDRAAMTNPKVIEMMYALSQAGRLTAPTPEGTPQDTGDALDPPQRAVQYRKDNAEAYRRGDKAVVEMVHHLDRQSMAYKRSKGVMT